MACDEARDLCAREFREFRTQNDIMPQIVDADAEAVERDEGRRRSQCWRRRFIRRSTQAKNRKLRHFRTEIRSEVADFTLHVEASMGGKQAKVTVVTACGATDFVIYNGVEVIKGHPKKIISAQRIVGFSDGHENYYRIKYGDEWSGNGVLAWADQPCGDCAVVAGQYHTGSCDVEECSKCRGQALGCPCARLFKFELIGG
jgi:hypothetical protein